MLDADADVVRKIFDSNVIAAAQWFKTALAAGLGSPEHPASVVNVASIAGFNATGMIGWYAVSKAAVIHLTRELAYQLGPAVRVNAVAPAVVKTRFAEALYVGHEEPVSYTHLDVYKRQSPCSPDQRPTGRTDHVPVPWVGAGPADSMATDQ